MLKDEHIVFITLVRVGLVEKVSSMGIQGRGNSWGKAPRSVCVSWCLHGTEKKPM